MSAISHHAALIYAMVLVSASDRNMTDAEMRKIGEIITGLPVFADYNQDLLAQTTASCAEFLDDENGLDKALAVVAEALPPRLRETAYALACDVAAADERVEIEESRMLELIRDRLGIEPLVAAAIERAARARFATV
jgi:tellurite resistance protein